MSLKTVEAQPKNASYLDTYGWILFQLEKYVEAETYLKQSLENGGDKSGEVLEHYGDVLFEIGRPDEALGYWNQALETGEGSEGLEAKIKSRSIVD